MKQRILSWVLVVALMFTACPFSGAADEWTATVPITVAFTDATGIDLNIRLNPLLVETATLVDPADSIGQATYAAHQNGEKMKVAIASATPISNKGVLFYLRLTLKAQAGVEDELCKLLQVKINETITWQASDCILLTGVKDGGIYNRDVTVGFNEGTATLNGQPFDGGTVSAEGAYALAVTDLKGNRRDIAFSIDKTAPVITVLPYDTELTKAPLTVYATVNEGQLNTDSHTFEENGQFTFTAVDAAGNTTSETVTIQHLYTDFTLSLAGIPQDLQVVQGLAVDVSGWTLQVTYNNDVQREYVVTNEMIRLDTGTPGLQQGTVSFDGKTVSFDCLVIAKAITSVDIAKQPTKLQYVEGTAFDPAGMELTVYYNDHTSLTITEGWQVDYDFNSVGEAVVTVFYGGHSTTLPVEIVAKSLTGIAVTAPTKNTYLEAKDALDVTGGKLTLRYDNGASEEINLTTGMITGFDNAKVGKQTLTVTYAGFTDTFEVEVVAKSLTGISVTAPTKNMYLEAKDTLDVTGGKVTLSYNNGTTTEIALTTGMVTGFDNAKVGKQTLTVTYAGFTDTFEVEVVAKSLTGISVTAPTKNMYLEAKDTLDVTGGKLTLRYDNGTTAEINLTADMVTGFDNTKVGKQTLTVTYAGFTDTFEVEIVAKSLIGIAVATPPEKVVYAEADNRWSVIGGKVTLRYDNGTSEEIDFVVEMITAFDGDRTLTVSYQGYKVVFETEVEIETAGLLGDVDGDGGITSTDARLTLQFYAGKIGDGDLNLALADVDGDGSITSTDARLILQKYAGKIEKFPAE